MRIGALSVVAVLFALVVSTALAKEGVVAEVLTPIARDAKPGTKVNVVWTLASVEGEESHPFGGAPVFIRLFGPQGSHTKRVYGTEVASGRFRATLRIPRGGARRVVVGLMGEACDAAGCRPSAILFRVVGRPIR